MTDKKQIEEMAKVLKDYTKENHIMASHTILENYAEALYNAGYRKQEWISVDERLPNPDKTVLVCKTFIDKPYIDIGYVKDAETCCCASDEFIIKPWLHKLTHWMPLPEAPKMKGSVE